MKGFTTVHAIDHLLEYSALQLAGSSLALLVSSTAAAIAVFMIGYRLAGLPAGAVWVLLGLVRTAGPEHDASLDDIFERRNPNVGGAEAGDASSLASLGEKIAAAGAGHKVSNKQASTKD